MAYGPDAKDNDIISDAKSAFKEAAEAESENRDRALEDIRFARLWEQWPEKIKKQREEEGRPVLTFPRLHTFIRQVVNDARQNKPTIRTRPVDSKADPETAEVYNGIIRHIEHNSGADIAYDTAIDWAVSGGFGYWRIGMDYAHDDTFDMDLTIQQIPDPMSVYGDPWATSADGSDWNSAFVVERMDHSRFKREYPDADPVSWDGESSDPQWATQEWIQVAEWWVREKVNREIVQLSDGSVLDVERLNEVVEPESGMTYLDQLQIAGITPVEGRSRKVPSYKVKQCILTANDVLEQRDWPGKYIPIVPVYGDEVNEEGRRHFLSLIHPAIDAQRQFNFQRTAAVEMMALAPRVPYIGHAKAFELAPDKWATANTRSHAFIEIPDNAEVPQRQIMDARALGPMQLAASAQDDMKSVLGIFDAALGAQGNETSGRAIIARQREGDTSTFHFIDNLTRSIRHSGRILIDLIPHVWPDERIVRLMGEDGTVSEQKVNGPVPVMDQNGQQEMEQVPGMPPRPKMRVFSLTAGKYDLTATAGPSFTTKREEAATQMMELMRAMPAAAPIIGDLLAKNLDWPGADEIADRLKALYEKTVGGGQKGIPPELQKMIEEGQAAIKQLQAENEALKQDKSIEAKKLEVDMYEAETDRMKVVAETQIDLNDQRLRAFQPHDLNQPQPRPNGSGQPSVR